MKKLIITINILLAFYLTGGSQNEIFTEEFKENIRSRVDMGINTGIVIGVITPEGTSFFSYGVKSLKTNEPVDENTVFELGSITKTFTGLLLAEEAVNGKVNLNDPLQKYVPKKYIIPTRNGEEIKLVNLANHTSALPRMPDNYEHIHPENPFADLTIENTYEFINTYELPYDIGTKVVYSNLGMGLLGNVLAANNNTNYESLVEQKIIQPLGMESTFITLTPEMEDRMAQGYRMGEEVGYWSLPATEGAGGIRSTAVDMLKYLAANMGIQESELYQSMQLAHKPSGAQVDIFKFGLGWITMPVEEVDVIWHDGAIGGFMSFAGFIKGGDRGVVVLTNSHVYPDDIGFHLLVPQYELPTPKLSIAATLNKIIESYGADSAVAAYKHLKQISTDSYDFSFRELNKLGYKYIYNKQYDNAITILKLNVETYPDNSAAHDMYAEALLENSMEKEAIESYKKSIELNPENFTAIQKLKDLGIEIEPNNK